MMGSVQTTAQAHDSETSVRIPPRAFPIPLLQGPLPRNWLAKSVLASHIANGVNLLFPAGERFFVRSVRHYRDAIEKDPELAAAVRGFAGQEAHHAKAHEALFETLAQQGLRIEPFLRFYEKLGYGLIEPRTSPALRLATTAALEHFTAVLAENFLTEVDSLDVHPAVRELLMWHACEEIEHRAVAFEVFERVDGRYSMRMAGMAMATLMLIGFWLAATGYLVAQEEDPLGLFRREGAAVKDRQPISRRVFGRGIKSYLARGFHPKHATHLDALAERFLARMPWTQ